MCEVYLTHLNCIHVCNYNATHTSQSRSYGLAFLRSEETFLSISTEKNKKVAKNPWASVGCTLFAF